MSELEVFIERLEVESGLVNPIEWFIEKHDLKRKDRSIEIKTLRQYLMYLCRKKLRRDRNTYPKIARMFDKDHTTVIHAERKINDLLQTKDKYIRHIITKYAYDVNLINLGVMTFLEWMKRYAFDKDTEKGYTTIKDLVNDYNKHVEKWMTNHTT